MREPPVTAPSPELAAETPVEGRTPAMVREAAGVTFHAEAAGAKTVPAYTMRAMIPWDKLSDFVRGVVTPLRQDGAELTVEVLLEGQSGTGIQSATLDQKVRETLRQIGATIKEESR